MQSALNRTEADTRRATSDLYYALFHAVCEELSGVAQGKPDDEGYKEVYRALYRLPNHGPLYQRCQELQQRKHLATNLKSFAQWLAAMKGKRDLADYDPLARFSSSEIENDIINTSYVLSAFLGLPDDERKQFALLLAVDPRRSRYA